MPDREAELEERIRQRAHRLWREEGCPPGGEERYREMASEIIAIEDSQAETLEPNPLTHPQEAETPVEPVEAVENAGEFPTLTDQGEGEAVPARREPVPAPLPTPDEEQREKGTGTGSAKDRG